MRPSFGNGLRQSAVHSTLSACLALVAAQEIVVVDFNMNKLKNHQV